MGSEWVTFQEIAELIRQSANPEDMDDNTPYIGLEHIEEGTLRLVGIGRAKTVTSTKFRFSKGDILFGKLRPYFRKVIRPDFDGVCSTDIWVVQAKQGVDQGYLYYWMASNDFVNFATQGSEGTKMPRAKWEHVGRFQRLRLSEYEQHAIAHILGSLDDKIELNRRMNKTLEAIARAIFKSWFINFDPVIDNALRADKPIPDSIAERVEMRRQILEQNKPSSSSQRAKDRNYRGGFDFSSLSESSIDEIYGLFPDSFQDSELGAIPKGWIVGKVSDFANVTSGKRPQKRSKEKTAEFNIPLYGGGGVMAFVSKPMIKEPFLLTGRVGTLSKIFRITEACWPSDNTLLVFPKDKIHLQFLFFMLQRIDFDSLNRGSTQPLITQTDLQNQSIIIPSRNIMNSFLKIVYPLFEKIDKDILESNTLASLRDALLPKLISGELRVPDAVAIIKGVEL